MLATTSAQQMIDTFQRTPRLGAAILWAASRDEAMVVEHLVSIGRRSALVRTAHLLVELGLRLQLVGLGSDSGFACPLNQYLMADALGLTDRIPCYRLGEVLRAHPALREVSRLTLGDGFRCLRLALWDEDRQRLVSFRRSRQKQPDLEPDPVCPAQARGLVALRTQVSLGLAQDPATAGRRGRGVPALLHPPITERSIAHFLVCG